MDLEIPPRRSKSRTATGGIGQLTEGREPIGKGPRAPPIAWLRKPNISRLIALVIVALGRQTRPPCAPVGVIGRPIGGTMFISTTLTRRAVAIAVAALATVATTATSASATSGQSPDPTTDVRLITFNDLHGNLEPPSGSSGLVNLPAG
jgi:hypothetical protein